MHRFFLPRALTPSLTITEPDLWKELTLVKRARVGERVIFFDGENPRDHTYTISAIDKRSVTLELEASIPNGSQTYGTLYQALPNKLEKMELIVQKATEIGIDAIVFFQSERSQSPVLSEAKQARLRRIITEAVEQSGGWKIPRLTIAGTTQSLNIRGRVAVLHTQPMTEQSTLPIERLDGVIIGPEGGFSTKEEEIFRQKGCSFLHLWERILRAETAAICAAWSLYQAWALR